MIGVFLGNQNEGKTLTMTYFLKKYYDKGYTIFTNYNVNFKHEKINLKLIEEYTLQNKQFKNTIFAIDELYIFFDSRNFGKKINKIFSYLLLQSSKRDVHIIGTAQVFDTIEKRFRNNVNFKCFCSRVLIKNNDIIEINTFSRFLTKEQNKNLYIKCLFQYIKIKYAKEILYSKDIYIKAEKIFNIYDTKELVNIENE